MPRNTSPAPLAPALALLVALFVALDGCSGGAAHNPSPSATSQSAPPSGFEGAALPANLPPRDFALTDQNDRRVTLSDYRGRVAILTFLATGASGASPLVAQQIRGALDDLGQATPTLAVSADPSGDSRGRIRSFLRANSLTGRLEYLTGTPAQLRPIWRAYRVTPASAGRSAFDRSAIVFLIDRHGRERVVFGVEQLTPEALAHDIRALQADPG